MYLIDDPKEILAAQGMLGDALKVLPHIGTCRVGYKTGGKTVELFGNGEGELYGGVERIADGNKFWNVFGVLSRPDQVQDIVVQLNLDLRDRRPAGFLAKDDAGHVILLHTGAVGGGVKGIGKKVFREWTGEHPVEVRRKARRPLVGFLVADLSSPGAIRSIEQFVLKVRRFKLETKHRADISRTSDHQRQRP